MNTRIHLLAASALALSSLVIGNAGAVVSQVPLTGSSLFVAPNLMFTLDDSGSMDFECVPDALCINGARYIGVRYSHSYKRLSKGFTLIEVMIVVAIVAILAAIAYPSYLESVRKSKRAEARAQLLETVQYMQRFYSQNDRFDKAIDGTPISLPDSLARVPRQGPQTYSIGFAAGSLQRASFTLQAARSGSMISDRCGTLQINNAGRRQISDASPGVTVDECWR